MGCRQALSSLLVGIAAASIQDNDIDRGSGLRHGTHDVVDIHGRVFNIGLFPYHGIHRDKIVASICGNAVSGEIEQIDTARIHPFTELTHRRFHILLVQVFEMVHLKPHLSQCSRYVSSIADRLL